MRTAFAAGSAELVVFLFRGKGCQTCERQKEIPITPYLKLRPLGMRRLSIEIRDISGNRNIGLTEKQPLPLCRLLTLLLNCPRLQ